MLTYIFSFLSRNGISRPYGSSMFEEFLEWFPKWLHHSTISLNSVWGFWFLYILANHLLSSFFILAILVVWSGISLCTAGSLNTCRELAYRRRGLSFWLLGYAVLRYFIFSSLSSPSFSSYFVMMYSHQPPAPPYVSGSRSLLDERFQWSQDADTNMNSLWPTPAHTVGATRNKHDR